MKKTEKKIVHHNREVFARFYEPEQEQKFPVVIFSHGYNGWADDFASYAELLGERGIGSVCLDFCGGSVRSRSSMKTTEMTIFSEKEDLCAVLDAVCGMEQADTDNVFLFGGSQGGLVSALAAEEEEKRIKGLILLYPALCIADNWNERFPQLSDIPDEQELWEMKLGRIFFETLHGFVTFDHVGHFSKKVLLMHGDQDPVVPLSYSEKAAALFPQAKLVVFPGEGHGFSPEGDKKAAELTCAFVEEG